MKWQRMENNAEKPLKNHWQRSSERPVTDLGIKDLFDIKLDTVAVVSTEQPYERDRPDLLWR